MKISLVVEYQGIKDEYICTYTVHSSLGESVLERRSDGALRDLCSLWTEIL
jgi:hypothetical protein